MPYQSWVPSQQQQDSLLEMVPADAKLTKSYVESTHRALFAVSGDDDTIPSISVCTPLICDYC